MRAPPYAWLVALTLATPSALAQAPAPDTRPFPDPQTLMQQVEQNQRRMEALQREYTYHVHTEVQSLEKDGALKKTDTEDAESLTLNGIRVDRIVAKNGKPLTPDEQRKEDERLEKEVAKGRERQAKAQAGGDPTDDRGQKEVTLSRILELGAFSNPRRTDLGGRPTILLDYNGNPAAKTHSAFETVFRDLTGTLWIDETDRILVRGQGRFVRDFKLGGGLLVDLRKNTSFDFQAHQVAPGIWLPGSIDAHGAARMLLLASFRGNFHLTTSDYRRFHASATIVGSHGAISEDGKPLDVPATSAPQ